MPSLFSVVDYSDDAHLQFNLLLTTRVVKLYFQPRFTFDDAGSQICAMQTNPSFSTSSETKPAPAAGGRTYGGLSPAQRTAQRRQQFLEAGLEMFGTVGFRASTVRSICKQAKLTDRYFYECCGSLESLLMAVYEQCMTNLARQIIDVIVRTYETEGAEAAMRAGLDTYFEALEEPRVARICMSELEGISEEVNDLYNRYIQSFARILNEMARHVFPDWQISEDERNVIGISLVGALRQSATYWTQTNYESDRDTMVRGTMRLFQGIIQSVRMEQN